MAAVHVVGSAAGRQVDVAQLVVAAHRRPDIRGARVAPGLVLPGLDPGLSRAWDRTERPPQLPRPDIEAVDIARHAGHPGGRVLLGHRRPQHHHVADNDRRPVPAVGPCTARGRCEIDTAAGSELGDRFSRARVQRIEVSAAEREDASVSALAPVRDPAIGAAYRELALGHLLYPDRPARRRIERLDQPDSVRCIQHAADHDGGRAEVVARAQLRILFEQRGVDLRPSPGDA